MNSEKNKVSLLSEMIAFALVDGELHHLEIIFLTDVAENLQISKSVYLDLFSRNYEPTSVKDPFSKIVHYYQLALLMHSDGKLHVNEQFAINEIGTRMGLTENVMNVILEMVSKAKNKKIPSENLMKVYNMQYN
jgi:uncharacterized tellurite resistance protein B-like protein